MLDAALAGLIAAAADTAAPSCTAALADGGGAASRDLREIFGIRTASGLLQRARGVSARKARDRIRLARQTLPRTGDTAHEAAAGTDSKLGLPPEEVRLQAELWRDALDPDGVEPRCEMRLRRRSLSISRTPRCGLHTVSGAIPPDVAAKALALMGAFTTPRRRTATTAITGTAAETASENPVETAQLVADTPASTRVLTASAASPRPFPHP